MADQREDAARALAEFAATSAEDAAQRRSTGIDEVAAAALRLHLMMHTQPPPHTPPRDKKLMQDPIEQTPYKYDHPFIAEQEKRVVAQKIAAILQPIPPNLAPQRRQTSAIAKRFVDWLETKALQQANPRLFFFEPGNWKIQWEIYQAELRAMAASEPGGAGAGADDYMVTVEFH